MTSPSEPHEPLNPADEALVDTWFARQHRSMGTDLAAALDLDTGLHEILLAGQHRDMGTDLADALDLDAGLAAILPHYQLRLTRFANFTELLDRLSAAPMLRLTHRHQLRLLAIDTEIFRLASTRALNLDLVGERARSLARVRARALSLDLALAHALNVVGALARDLDFARDLDLARNHAHALVRDLAQDRNHAHPRNHALARAHSHAHALAHFLALAHVLARSGDQDRARYQVYALVQMLCEMLVHLEVGDLLSAINGQTLVDTSWLNLATIGPQETDCLNRLAADFTGVDLREVKLSGLDLIGVRWSRTTRWPPDDVDWIVAASEPIGNGVYVIKESTASGGATIVPDPVSV